MRVNRIPQTDTHALRTFTPGKNRFQPGEYICTCGNSFTGINKIESHIADERRKETAEKDRD